MIIIFVGNIKRSLIFIALLSFLAGTVYIVGEFLDEMPELVEKYYTLLIPR